MNLAIVSQSISHHLILLKYMTIQGILKKSIDELKHSLGNSSRKVILILSLTQLIAANGFYISQKITTGRFFYHYSVGIINCSLSLFCLFTAIYYYYLLKNKSFLFINKIEKKLPISIEDLLKWIIAILLMAYCSLVMSGYGNISSDTLLFDFSLGHTFIFIISILLGRNIAIIWSMIVIVILCVVAYHNGFNSSYNYLTPQESRVYEAALASKKKWAIDREKILTKNHLNTPKKSKYFIQWFFLLIVATVIAYYFNGVSYQIFKIIPQVSNELETAMEESINTEKKHLNTLNEIEGQKLLLKQEALKSELNLLKAQVNPHFLYNTLNYFYIKSYEYSEELAESIRKLSDIMRYSLKTTEIVSDLDEEIECVKMLISLHQVRYSNNLCIVFEQNTAYKKNILPLILITLVENAFKHGKLNDPKIPLKISIETTLESIIFFISNKKNNRKNFKKTTSLGLQNIRTRLDLYYQKDSEMTIEEDEINYTCKLTINDNLR